MRRSCAPSMKRSVELKTNQILQPSTVLNNTARNSMPHFSETQLSTKTTDTIKKSSISDEQLKCEYASKTIFKVVWTKISNRKHKIWEGDGLLEVSGRNAVLKDETGTIISSTNGLKVNEVTEGIQLVVGSKEVDVLEKCDGNRVSNLTNQTTTENDRKRVCLVGLTRERFKPPQRIQQKSQSSENTKKYMLQQKHVPLNNATSLPHESCLQENIGSTHFKFVATLEPQTAQELVEPLIMKKPSFEHQFHNNASNDAVAEVHVPLCLTQHLRPHQREGVAFLYECVTGMRMVEPSGNGAILADEMGLGKTLQCIALMYTLMKTGPYGKPSAKRILIVTPSSLVDNWDREITKWLQNQRVFTFIVGPNNKLKQYVQSQHIPILIISYEMLSKQISELESVKFDLIFCDEGHRLKNSNVKAFAVLNKIECKRRVLLTGTPIQNDLQEFFSLINFVNPGIIGSYQDFKARYETPIVVSQRPGVLPQSIELGIERLNELNNITGRFVLRRTQEVINEYLPDKHELVVFCQPSELQTKLTRSALQFYEDEKGSSNGISPLQMITILKKICNHPSLVSMTKKGDPESLVHLLSEQLPAWQEMGPGDSAKLGIVEVLLESIQTLQEKIVIVSYYNKTLDMIAGLCEHCSYKFSRLDGSTVTNDRGKIVSIFNNPASDIFILLLSAKAGGAGLNLVGASRLVLYDNDWNPANDLQAMSRIWRDGQRKPVFIYRLLTAYSIEERIFQRQISKTSLSGTVVDQKQNLSNLKLSDDELKDLFSIIHPNHMDDCLTHSLLECPCAGIGKAPVNDQQNEGANPLEEIFHLEETDSPFQMRGVGKNHNKKNTEYALKMQELMRWEHHRAPVSELTLEQLGLSQCVDEILFLFRNIVSVRK